jgi:hypothetical protein
MAQPLAAKPAKSHTKPRDQPRVKQDARNTGRSSQGVLDLAGFLSKVAGPHVRLWLPFFLRFILRWREFREHHSGG